jgi:hypothetical protein
MGFTHMTELYCRLLLGNKVGRIFAVAYLLAIHSFLFGLTYYAALVSHPIITSTSEGGAS